MEDLKTLSLLKPPGMGLLTVSTGSDLAKSELGKNYRDQKNWNNKTTERLESIKLNDKPFLIGIPSDSGGGICRGAAHGPLHLRKELYALDTSWVEQDLGDIPCIPHLLSDSMLSDTQLKKSGKALWGDAYTDKLPVSPLDLLEAIVDEVLQNNPIARFLVLGGDHSISGPVFSAFRKHDLYNDLAVLHIDAHTDLMTERFGVENCFATWTSHALKPMKDPSCWVQIGIRASRQNKEYWQKKFGLKQFWSEELLNRDPKQFSQELIDHYLKRGCKKLYISHDIDGTDQKYAPATGTPESKGLLPEWLELVIKEVSEVIPLLGSDLVEVAPVLGGDKDRKITMETCHRYLSALQWE